MGNAYRPESKQQDTSFKILAHWRITVFVMHGPHTRLLSPCRDFWMTASPQGKMESNGEISWSPCTTANGARKAVARKSLIVSGVLQKLPTTQPHHNITYCARGVLMTSWQVMKCLQPRFMHTVASQDRAPAPRLPCFSKILPNQGIKFKVITRK